jgi:hypothetical protein
MHGYANVGYPSDREEKTFCMRKGGADFVIQCKLKRIMRRAI